MGYQLKSGILASNLAKDLNLRLIGNDNRITNVSSLSSIEHNTLCFFNQILESEDLQNLQLNNFLEVTVISDVNDVENFNNFNCLENISLLYSPLPRLDFIKALSFLELKIGFNTYEFESIIHPSVKIGSNVVIEKGCVIEEDVILEHNVVIQKGTSIGKSTRIRANSSIGGDGFGFERLASKVPIRFPHLGGVKIGQFVEVGSNVCIARGTLSDTIIEDNVKIDNLVHIAHNCHIEKNVLITACAEISGGVTVGENTWISPNCSIIQKVSIGKNAMVGIGAVVVKNIEDDTRYAGNPARKLH